MSFWFKAGLVVTALGAISFLIWSVYDAGREVEAAKGRERLLQAQVDSKTEEVKRWATAAAMAAAAAHADKIEAERLADRLDAAEETKDKILNEKNRIAAACIDKRDTDGLRNYFEQTDPNAGLDATSPGQCQLIWRSASRMSPSSQKESRLWTMTRPSS